MSQILSYLSGDTFALGDNAPCSFDSSFFECFLVITDEDSYPQYDEYGSYRECSYRDSELPIFLPHEFGSFIPYSLCSEPDEEYGILYNSPYNNEDHMENTKNELFITFTHYLPLLSIFFISFSKSDSIF